VAIPPEQNDLDYGPRKCGQFGLPIRNSPENEAVSRYNVGVTQKPPGERSHAPGGGHSPTKGATVDTERIARNPAPITPTDPEDHAALLEAAVAALRWFDAFDRHAPGDWHVGGEAKVRRQLRRAIARAAR
jgi:hypothetical protein